MIRKNPPKDDGGLALAIHAAGGRERLAEILGVSRQAVAQASRLDPERLLTVERATGMPRHVLRPDLFHGYVRVAL